jgi:hypothetical protein
MDILVVRSSNFRAHRHERSPGRVLRRISLLAAAIRKVRGGCTGQPLPAMPRG